MDVCQLKFAHFVGLARYLLNWPLLVYLTKQLHMLRAAAWIYGLTRDGLINNKVLKLLALVLYMLELWTDDDGLGLVI